MVILAVKPQDVKGVLEGIKNHVGGQIMVSIAAGVKIKSIEAVLGKKKIVRVMPNTPCLVGEMAAGFAPNSQLTKKDGETIKNILDSCGKAFQMEEDLLDAVTGLSGSGPAFVAYLIEAFGEAGAREKLPEKISYDLAVQTFYGTAKLLREKQMSTQELIAMVTSPKGTTAAGREILESSDVKEVIARTVRKAAGRSREMGN